MPKSYFFVKKSAQLKKTQALLSLVFYPNFLKYGYAKNDSDKIFRNISCF
jgi:hypothetical protein